MSRLEGISPAVLRWARESVGLTLDDVAAELEKNREVVDSWEQGADSPTYAQLERLAYVVYKRPLAVFFMPAPPAEPSVSSEFRTLPEFEVANLAKDTRLAVREALARQLSLAELVPERSESPNIVREFSAPPNVSAAELAQSVRRTLGVTIDEQIGWTRTVDALLHWRSAVEEVGIYVFKRSFKQREVSGFCLLDADFPLIVLNNSSSFSRQIFTLFHELGHLLLQVSGVCKVDDSYIEHLSGESKRIEVLCNRFAAEFLVPLEDFIATSARLDATDRSIALLANRYKVSRPVIARRFLDLGKLTQVEYGELLAQYTHDYYRNQAEEGGGNYYSTQAAYLSQRYADVVLTRFYEGKIDRSAVADYFGVKATSLPRLEQALMGRISRG